MLRARRHVQRLPAARGHRCDAGDLGERATVDGHLVVVGGAAQQVVARRVKLSSPPVALASSAGPAHGVAACSRRGWRCRGESAATRPANTPARRPEGVDRPEAGHADDGLVRRAVGVERPEGADQRRGHHPVAGQLRPRGLAGAPAASKACRSSDAVPASISSPGRPSMSATDRPGEERQVVLLGRAAGPTWPVAVSQAEVKSWPPWYSWSDRGPGAQQPGRRATNEGCAAAEVAERRVARPRGRSAWSVLPAPALARLASADRLAAGRAEARRAVAVEDVAEPAAGDRPDLRALAAARARQRRDHRGCR